MSVYEYCGSRRYGLLSDAVKCQKAVFLYLRQSSMSKLTIEVPEERRRALKAAAARRGLTIAQLIDESLRLNGVRMEAEVEGLLNRLRANATLSDADALAFGVRVTREARRG
jgi:hypothetical protein